MATIPPGNDPFFGGSITRSGQSNVAGGIASANTGVGNPIGGVNPGSIFSARNNQGSNIGIPYTRYAHSNTNSQPASVPSLRVCSRLAARRLVPLGSKQGGKLGRPPRPAVAGGAPDPPDLNVPVAVSETENLRSMTVAFILGKRSAPGLTTDYVEPNGTEPFDQNVDLGFSYNTNGLMAPGMPGTERFQKLCSFEYLSRYFTNTLWSKGIILRNTNPGANPDTNGGTFAQALGLPVVPPQWTTGLPRMAKTAAQKRTVDIGVVGGAVAGADLAAGLRASTLTEMNDIGKTMGLPRSEAAIAPDIRQGIFARDEGPFLRGKGITHTINAGTAGGQPQDIGVPAPIAPYHVSRCAGDELAFALFERLLEEKGFSDWRPDGIVLSKGADDPSDKLSDEYLKSRDGELFNMRIQGPAVTSSWCGDPAMEVMPLDKVFVVIVADVWWGDLATAEGDVQRFVEQLLPANGAPTAFLGDAAARRTLLRKYLAAREKEFSGTNGKGLLESAPKPRVPVTGAEFAARPDDTAAGAYLVAVGARPGDAAGQALWDNQLAALQEQWDKSVSMATFKRNQEAAYRTGETTRLCNFRVMLATSAQMINFSALRFDGAGVQVTADTATDEFRRVHNQSRMGLRLGRNGGEYIVGGWCVGNVLDTAASRAAFPSAGTNIGVRTAPNSMAINLNVKVEWWDSDRLWRSFMNVDGSLTPRYVKTKPLVGVDVNAVTGAKTPNGKFLYTAPNMPPMVALALREQYVATVTNAVAGPIYNRLEAGAIAGGAPNYAALVNAVAVAAAAANAAALALAETALRNAKVLVARAQIPSWALA